MEALKARFQRCAAAQAGILSKEDATMLCRKAILGSRGLHTQSTRRRTSSNRRISSNRRRRTTQRKSNRA
jgi:hypothetical protein